MLNYLSSFSPFGSRHHPQPAQVLVKSPSDLPSKKNKPRKALRLRRSIYDIQTDWENGDHEELENLILAWKGIQEKPHTDPQSFFQLAGFHGAPFRGKGETDISYWGGYCQHGNILFPVWHRAYMLALEDALRTIKPNVTLPFLDETCEYARTKGLPWVLTRRKFTFACGEVIDNPLFSFKIPVAIVDKTTGAGASHSKPAGYETRRYPLSGLVGTDQDRMKTEAHNARFPDDKENEEHLNANFMDFLNDTVTIEGKPYSAGAYENYLMCLTAPNYTIFSNTTSVSKYNNREKTAVMSLESPHNMIHVSLGSEKKAVVALEDPHNTVHIAIGGYDGERGHRSPILGANGDMGENDVAGLDPIFFFHHCFVDYVFWQWQKAHDATCASSPLFHIDYSLEGTSTSDHQGPPPGFEPNQKYSLDSPLNPFFSPSTGMPYTGKETINILEEPMCFDYDKGSLASKVEQVPIYTSYVTNQKVLEVSGIDKTKIPGSFIIDAYATVYGDRQKIGSQAILSRWKLDGCKNCQAHLEATAHFVLPADADDSSVIVQVRTHDFTFAWDKKNQKPANPNPGFEDFSFTIFEK